MHPLSPQDGFQPPNLCVLSSSHVDTIPDTVLGFLHMASACLCAQALSRLSYLCLSQTALQFEVEFPTFDVNIPPVHENTSCPGMGLKGPVSDT